MLDVQIGMICAPLGPSLRLAGRYGRVPSACDTGEVRAIVERVCARPEVLDACARRDLGAVINALTDKRTGGLTQGKISELTGRAG